jgi:hypothetical protein
MRTKFILITIVIIVIALVLIAQNFPGQSIGPHGGTVKQAESYCIEVKNPPGVFYAYLLDKKLKAVSNKGISCEVIFYAVDNSTSNVVLKPDGADAFYTENITPYESCRVTFNVFGKSVSAKFQNETLMVKKQ